MIIFSSRAVTPEVYRGLDHPNAVKEAGSPGGGVRRNPKRREVRYAKGRPTAETGPLVAEQSGSKLINFLL